MRAIHQHVVKALGWLLFLVSLWFVVDFTSTASRRLAQVEESRVAFDRQFKSSIQHNALNALATAAATKSAEATSIYTEHLAALEETGHVSTEVLARGRTVVDEALVRIAMANGALVAVFAADPLDSAAVALRSRLQRMNADAGILAAFFDNYQTAGPVTAIRRLNEQEAWIDTERVDVGVLRVRVWDEQAAVTAGVWSAERMHSESAESFLARLRASTLAIMYCAAVVAVMLRSRWQHGHPVA